MRLIQITKNKINLNNSKQLNQTHLNNKNNNIVNINHARSSGFSSISHKSS
jgi:hypothetical protein